MKVTRVQKNPRGETTNEMLTFELTEAEVAEKGRFAAESQGKLAEVKNTFRDVSESYKDEIKGLTEEIRSTLNCIRSGKEDRETECVKVLNSKTGITEFWFDGVCMKERPTTDWDRQRKLPMQKQTFNPVIDADAEDVKKKAANDR